MASPVTGIQPAILQWAREQAGCSAAEVARAFNCDESVIFAWETGAAAPTHAQLEKLAYSVYKRPLAVFFLPSHPLEPSVSQEFRTLPDFEIRHLSSDTRYQIRLAHAFQISLHELHNDRNPANRLIFRDFSLSVGPNVSAIANQIREYLALDLATQPSWKNLDDALWNWRKAIEDVGIHVFKHSMKQKVVSGFCLRDDEFPLIYLNNGTAKTRQIFTLFHELSHLLLNVNALTLEERLVTAALPPREQAIEFFCNQLAAEILVPTHDFSSQLTRAKDYGDEFLERMTRRYWVSRETILRRLLDRGLVDQGDYERRTQLWAKEVGATGSGGNYYATQGVYLSERYMDQVFTQHYQGKLSLEMAAEYLGVKTKSFAGLEALVLNRAVKA